MPDTVSVVIPAFNESATIGRTLGLVGTFLGDGVRADAEIVVVDDGSTDDTAAVASSSGAPGLRVVRLGANAGKGAAARAGVAVTRGDVVVVTDADGDYLHNDCAPYLDALRRGADVVLASRVHERSHWTWPEPLAGYACSRRRLGRVFNALVRCVMPLHVHDTQTGLKIMRGAAARALFARLRTDRFAYDVELVARARTRGMKVVELPLTYVCSSAETKVRFVDKPRMVLDLLRIRGLVR